MVYGQVPMATTPLASITLRVKLPAVAGVPEMAPVEGFRERPLGRVPVATAKVYGEVPPATERPGALNGVPTVPVLTAEQVREGAGTMLTVQPVATTPLLSR